MKINDKIAAIGFAPELIPLIQSGTKTLTYRIGNKYEFLNIGDKVPIKNSSTGEEFAEVEITEKSFTNFGDLPIDGKGHEIYSSKENQRKIFEKYYGKDISDGESILVLGFKIIK